MESVVRSSSDFYYKKRVGDTDALISYLGLKEDLFPDFIDEGHTMPFYTFIKNWFDMAQSFQSSAEAVEVVFKREEKYAKVPALVSYSARSFSEEDSEKALLNLSTSEKGFVISEEYKFVPEDYFVIRINRSDFDSDELFEKEVIHALFRIESQRMAMIEDVVILDPIFDEEQLEKSYTNWLDLFEKRKIETRSVRCSLLPTEKQVEAVCDYFRKESERLETKELNITPQKINPNEEVDVFGVLRLLKKRGIINFGRFFRTKIEYQKDEDRPVGGETKVVFEEEKILVALCDNYEKLPEEKEVDIRQTSSFAEIEDEKFEKLNFGDITLHSNYPDIKIGRKLFLFDKVPKKDQLKRKYIWATLYVLISIRNNRQKQLDQEDGFKTIKGFVDAHSKFLVKRELKKDTRIRDERSYAKNILSYTRGFLEKAQSGYEIKKYEFRPIRLSKRSS